MVFKTLAITDRAAALVTEDYLQGSRLDAATEQSIYFTKAEQYFDVSSSARAALSTISYDALLRQIRGNLTSLIRLSPAECRNTYSSLQMPSKFSNVLLISFSNISNTLDGFIDCELHYPEMTASHKQQGVQDIDWFNTNGTASIFHKNCIDTDFDFGHGVWNVPVWDYYCTATPYLVEYCLAQTFEPRCGVDVDTLSLLVSSVACLWSLDACLVWPQAASSLLVCHGIYLPYTLN